MGQLLGILQDGDLACSIHSISQENLCISAPPPTQEQACHRCSRQRTAWLTSSQVRVSLVLCFRVFADLRSGSEVAGITELVEEILIKLNPTDILTNATRVNKLFHNVIATSKGMQTVIFKHHNREGVQSL